MAAERVVYQTKTYEGQWSAYQKNYMEMSISDKIDYYEELGVLEKTFDRIRRNVWMMFYWFLIAFPGLMASMFLVTVDFAWIIRLAMSFVIAAVFCGIGYFLTRSCFVSPKGNGTFLLFFCVGYAIVGSLQGQNILKQSIGNAFLFTVLIGILVSIIYFILAKKGYTDLRENAYVERLAVEENLRAQLYSGPLETISLKTKFSLANGENAYMEEPAILIDMQQKGQYAQIFGESFGAKASQYFDVLTGERKFSTGMRKAWNMLLDDSNQFAQGLSKNAKKEKVQKPSIVGSVGSLIVTDDRIIYTTSQSGFQILLAELTTYHAQEGELNTLVLESKKGIRTLQTDAGGWIVLLLDRLKRRI